jgi:hypothetical protein
MKRIIALVVISCLLLTAQFVLPMTLNQTNGQSPERQTWTFMDYAPAPADNPLKGFMPFYDAYGSANKPVANDFPHSMEWVYTSLRNLMNGPDSFTFETGIEPQLQSIASRGHQAAMRVYLDYPGRPSGIPRFLLDDGLKVRPYTFFGNTLRKTDSVSPDYDDPRLIEALERFIVRFGARYDGDPRIGFVTLGLIGFWGEWHTWPMDGFKQETSVFKAASDPTEENWMPSYDKAFNQTRLLLRYPMLPPPGQQALPGQRTTYGSMAYNIGYHDDSFAYNTLYGEDWYFMGKMAWAGGINKWKTEPIGGELRPEIQLSVWLEPPTRKDMEDFNAAVEGTHVTWLIAHNLFTTKSVTSETTTYQAALAGARRMGYEFYVNAVNLPEASADLKIALRIQNTGVAPFYYNWLVEIGMLDSAGDVTKIYRPDWQITKILPASAGQSPYQDWTYMNAAHGLKPGTYTVLLRVVNPLPNGKALRFANATQDADAEGWLSLGQVRIGS